MKSEIDLLKEKIDFYYERIRPSQDIRIFLNLYEKYIRLLVKQENEKGG